MPNPREEKRPFSGYSKWSEPTPVEPEAPPESDAQLMRMAQQGDSQAITALYMRYRRKVLNYLYRLIGNRHVAEEMTQETFLRVVKHLPSYRPTGSVGGWIFRIAKNLALNSFRDKKGIQEVSLEESLPSQDSDEGQDGPRRAEVIADCKDSPQETAGHREVEREVQGALLKVAPPFREVLILCDIQGYAYREAAEILQCSINTVASRLARGRAKLAELLGYLKEEI